MDRTRSSGLRGSMASLMKHRHAPWAERRTCLLRRTIGAKVYGAIDDWLPAIRKLAQAVLRSCKSHNHLCGAVLLHVRRWCESVSERCGPEQDDVQQNHLVMQLEW